MSQPPLVVKASYWFVDSKKPADDIDSALFTYLFCAFADLNSQTHQVTIPPEKLPKFRDFTETVKSKNPHVQTLLSIGGENADKSAFVSMASSRASRKSFIDSSIKTARDLGFYGLDLAWEYPSTVVEMTNYGKLMEEWREAVNAEPDIPLLLTATVFYSPVYKSPHYPVQAIADNLDWVNIKAYDFYTPSSSKVTGPAAALYDPYMPPGPSGDNGIKKWIEEGLQGNKAVLGFSYRGWAWTLANEKNHDYGAQTTGPAISPDGVRSYTQIKEYIKDNSAPTVHSPPFVDDYCYAGNVWISYNDIETIVTKVTHAKQRGLLGYFAWDVSADDHCGLSRAASEAWGPTKKPT